MVDILGVRKSVKRVKSMAETVNDRVCKLFSKVIQRVLFLKIVRFAMIFDSKYNLYFLHQLFKTIGYAVAGIEEIIGIHGHGFWRVRNTFFY